MDQHTWTTRDLSLGRPGAAESRLRALTEVGRAATGLPVSDRRRRVLEAARAAMAAASVSLGVWRPELQLLQTVLNLGDLAAWEQEEPADEVYSADQSTWLAGVPDGHLGLVGVVGAPGGYAGDQELLASLGKHSFLSVPLLIGGAWWGELFFTRTIDQPAFADGDLEWATAVAAQVGAAVEVMEHLAEIDRLAHTDALTGLANRRAVDAWLDEAVGELHATGLGVSLVVADVNGLKQVNDEQGHDAGDRVLVASARMVEQVATQIPGSVTARMGGDEFCIAAADPDEVVTTAEELARRGWRELADAAQYRAKRVSSRHPVVAGRMLPDDAVGPVAHSETGRHPDRRLLRGHDSVDSVHVLDAGLRALDQAADEPTRARLGLVADLVTQQADAVGWWLSVSESDHDLVTTVEFAVYRAIPGLAPGQLEAELGASFPLGKYPVTAAVIDGGSCSLLTHDPATDPAERAILDDFGASGLVVAGGTDATGCRWLVKVFTDTNSRPLHALDTVLRLLVLAALHPVAAVR